MLFELGLGAMAMAAIFGFVSYARNANTRIPAWGWLLAALWMAYALFVVSATYTLIAESALRPALILGGILGLVAVVTAVAWYRFVFARGR